MGATDITPKKVKFSLVSSVSTAIDYGILLALTGVGLPLIGANYISSSVAFVFSFLASKKYAFQTPDHHWTREVIPFLVVTLTGIWVLQPLIIWGLAPVISQLGVHGLLVAFLAKIAASSVTFVWNYLFYTRVVFRKK